MKPAKMQENSGIAVSLRLPALVRRPIEGLKGLAAIVPKRCAHGAEKSQGKTLNVRARASNRAPGRPYTVPPGCRPTQTAREAPPTCSKRQGHCPGPGRGSAGRAVGHACNVLHTCRPA